MLPQSLGNPGQEKSVLPKNLSKYVESPKGTVISILKWVNARWQLRKCNKVGRFTRVTGKVFVNNMGEIVIGERVLILSHYAHSVFATFPGGIIEIGDRTFLNYGIDIAATKLVKIGKDCQIGTHVVILDNDFHMLKNRHQLPVAEPVIINNNVWIGNRALILPGVTIGENSVIGAGSVVVKSIPANSVAVGNPAKVIKEL